MKIKYQIVQKELSPLQKVLEAVVIHNSRKIKGSTENHQSKASKADRNSRAKKRPGFKN